MTYTYKPSITTDQYSFNKKIPLQIIMEVNQEEMKCHKSDNLISDAILNIYLIFILWLTAISEVGR